MITKLLIANRGEIACRIAHTCRRLGIRTVAVATEHDRKARHFQDADEAIMVSSYLNIEELVDAARRAGAQAVHPGFGFLAENAAFARACSEARLVFVGPSAEVIELMGDKAKAKEAVAAAGVPVLEGFRSSQTEDQVWLEAAKALGYPLMVKAVAGGGGKGMRLVQEESQLSAALAAARGEGQRSFGSAELLLEKALPRARHIEVQLLGDHHGNLLHLGERECSLQRRHQKVLEEAPAPNLHPELRAALHQAAVAAGRAVNYINAGTVEFLVHGNSFYFLEMNTRIQVEHPVTEMVTGLDLVAEQLRVAEGRPLPYRQDLIMCSGHAVEARLYAEDPANGFAPSPGKVHLWRPANAEGVRIDSGLLSEDEISVHYDPMVAKVIAHGHDRVTALRRLRRALGDCRLLGPANNREFLVDLLERPQVLRAEMHTTLLEDSWEGSPETSPVALLAASFAQAQNPERHWRNSRNRPLVYRYEGNLEVQLTPEGQGYRAQLGEKGFTIEGRWVSPCDLDLVVDGYRRRLTLCHVEPHWWVQSDSFSARLTAESLLPRPRHRSVGEGSVRAPLPGIVLELLVHKGDEVQEGAPLVKLEAMKMEHTLCSPGRGTVAEIYFGPGDSVAAQAEILKLSEGSA